MDLSASRRLTTILAADVVGFSRLVAASEEDTLARMAQLRAAFDDLIREHRGRVFNTAGDAIRAEFQSAIEAVRCAARLQEKAAELGAQDAADRRIRFRIGIAIGDVMDNGGDLLGEGVTLAERLEAMAPTGGLCIARAVHDAVAGKTQIPFAEVDGPAREGAGPVKAYAAEFIETAQATRAASEKVAGPVPPPADGAEAKAGGMPSWLSLAGLALLAFVGTVGGLTFMGQEKAPEPEPPKTAPQTRPIPPPPPPPPQERPATKVSPATPTPEPQPERKPPPAPPAPRLEPTAPAPPSGVPDRLREDGEAAALKRRMSECNAASGDAAINSCRAIIRAPGLLDDGEIARVNANLGKALLGKGQLDDALNAVEASLGKKPTTEAYNVRGIIRIQKGKIDASIDDFTEAIKLDRNNGEAFNNRAWARFKANLLRDALADAEEATKLVGDKAYAWDTKGNINEKLGNRTAAIADYRRAIELDKNANDAREALKRLGAK